MIKEIFIATTNLKVLQFLAKYSDKEFHEREISRLIKLASGSTNRALNNLYNCGIVQRRQSGKMLFYSINSNCPALIEFKKLTNMLLIEPLVEKLRLITERVVLYGSGADGLDNSKSDLDLHIVAANKQNVVRVLEDFTFPTGYAEIHIQTIIKTPLELLKANNSERTFLDEVEKGITLWDKKR